MKLFSLERQSNVKTSFIVNWCLPIAISRRLHIAVFILAFITLLSRDPSRIFNAQFWAEDGSTFYEKAHNFGVFRSLFMPYAGYLCITQRLVMSFVQQFPLMWAPFISNMMALIIQVLPVTIILSSRFVSVIPNFSVRLLLVLIYLLLPNSYEIYANIASAQWYLALLACLVILAKPSPYLEWRIFDFVVVLLLALSGPFAILLLPLAFLYWWLRPNRWTLILNWGLAIGLIVQGVALMVMKSDPRNTSPLEASPDRLVKILSGQIFFSALTGQTGYGKLIALPEVYHVVTGLMAMIGGAIILYALLKGPLELRIFILYGALIFAAALASATVSWKILILPGAAPRYWFVPMLVFLTCLVWLTQQRFCWIRVVAIALLAVLGTGIIADWRYPELVDLDFAKYVTQYEQSSPGTTTVIPINPPGWNMHLVKR
ncbi:hypothetical protein [Leptothermofonsia sp. ETS-13]|uniref:hypothetical protein n=1 Tax=Leptothermofonsia sp. ETS-13 TaxID=3035696 RepID=UPI003BA0EA31